MDDRARDQAGAAAIEVALGQLHPGSGSPRRYTAGATGPAGAAVQAILAFAAEGRWHLVTQGLSELGENPGAPGASSGWGFELTMKVPRSGTEEEAPGWAVNLLRVVGDSVYRTGQPLAEGSRLDIGAPVTGRLLSRLEALAITPDSELPPLDSASGRVEFLQVVGVTRAELEEMQATSTAAVLEAIRQGNPLLLTDPSR